MYQKVVFRDLGKSELNLVENFSGENETETRSGDLNCRSQTWWTDQVFGGEYTMKEEVLEPVKMQLRDLV